MVMFSDLSLFRNWVTGALKCGGCDSVTHVSSNYTCHCGRMLCGVCGNSCSYHRAETVPQEERLLEALKNLLAHDPNGDSCGCDESGHCSWHHAYNLVNELMGDKYGQWYFDLTGVDTYDWYGEQDG